MQKGLLQIQAKLHKVDCIIEIHDARIPLTGRNVRFRDIIKLRPHVLLLNKLDLTDLENNAAKKDNIVKTLQQQVTQELISKRPRYNREETEDFNYLVIGVPNVGKSTFINSLRSMQLQKKGKATTVGAIAGITKSVLSKIKVSVNPNIYVIDSPGIMPPKFDTLESAMKLAACSCLPDHLVGEINIADYILFWMNKHEHFHYVEHFEVEEASDDIINVLKKIALKHKAISRHRDVVTNQYVYGPNLTLAAGLFISAFREGKLGYHVLDDTD
ncbi:Mitochondrial GTPase [Bulinus truncatus]|nr:Mitochondrial GTPase [Bulinus truncatus]